MQRNGARRPLLSHLRRFCLRRHSLFSPPPRAGRQRRPPRSRGTGNKSRKSRGREWGAPHPKTSSPASPLPLVPSEASISVPLEAAASPYPARHLIPNQPRPHLCPRSPPSARRAPVTSLPTRPPIPHLRGKARLLSRTHQQRRQQPARTMSLSASTPPTPGLTHRTGAASRGGRQECPLPTTTPATLPGPRTHLQPTAAAGTSRGGQRESRRGPAAAGSSHSPPPPSDKSQAKEAGEPRTGSPHNHLFPGTRRCGERQGTRTSRPLCRRPLLLFYPCRKGWGTPRHGFSQSRISSASWTQPSRVPLRSTRRTPPRSRTLAPGKPGNRNRPEAGARVR